MKKYSKRFTRFYSNKINLALLIPVFLFLVAAVAFRYAMEDRAKAVLKEQTLLRQQVIVSSGAKSITSFFELTGHSLVWFASNLDLEEDIQKNLDILLAEWQGTPVRAVAYIDQNGVVRQLGGMEEFKPVYEEVRVAHLDIFQQLKTTGKGQVLVGDPMFPPGLKDPVLIVPVVTPLIRDEQFKGAIVMAVVLSDLTEEYLDPLKISEETRIYLINDKGIIIYSSLEQVIGQNYFEVLEEKQFPEKERAVSILRQALQSGEGGKMELILPNEKTGKFTSFLIAYSSVRRDEKYYVLAVATPVEDALVFYKSFRELEIVSFFVTFLSIIVFSAYIVLVVRMAQKKSFLDGLKQRIKSHHEKR